MHPFPIAAKALATTAYLVTLPVTLLRVAGDVLVHRHSLRGAR